MTRARDMANIAAGSFSIPSGSLTNAVPAAGSITNAMLASGAITSADLPAGTVLQTIQGWSDTQVKTTTTANGDAIACPATATITPISTSSKVLIMFYGMWHFGNNNDVCFWLFRDNTIIGSSTDTTMNAVGFIGAGQPADNTYTPSTLSFQYLDSPATTSAVTYSIKGGGIQGTISSGNRGLAKLGSSQSQHMAWNRAENDSGSDSIATGSAFILQEIAG